VRVDQHRNVQTLLGHTSFPGDQRLQGFEFTSPPAEADLSIHFSSVALIERSDAPVRVDIPAFYRPELDALRFFAFFAVYVHHTVYNLSPLLSISGGFGLSLFFFLSAFLITELIQREINATGSVNIRDFYIRRVLRIWPLYFLAIIGAIFASIIFPAYRISPGFVLSYLFMMGNVYISRYGFPSTIICYLWSISVEEQFYLLWPILNKKLSRKKLVIAAAALLPVGSFAVILLSLQNATPAIGIWPNSFVQVQTFALGALTALALNGRIPKLVLHVRFLLLIAGALLWTAAARFSGIDDRLPRDGRGPMIGYWAVGLGCLFLLISVLGIERKMIPQSIVYLGKISYGLYVYHQLSLDLSANLMNHFQATNSVTQHTLFGIGHALLGMALTIALAVVSYRFFEKPFLRMKERFAVIHSRAA
jgi:peptidoglycan/LPS O-acetylase OafA/YrhL